MPRTRNRKGKKAAANDNVGAATASVETKILQSVSDAYSGAGGLAVRKQDSRAFD